jgi:hypothetical protein
MTGTGRRLEAQFQRLHRVWLQLEANKYAQPPTIIYTPYLGVYLLFNLFNVFLVV